MASATAPAGRKSLLRTLAALGLAVCLAAPAWAGDQVFIWRDAGGAVRFSSLDEPAQPIACVREEPFTPASAPELPIVVADAS